MSIYERIELLIKNAGMTKKAFCLELGISTGNFGDWKRGKSTPSTNKLIEIAAFFDVSLDWLMTGKEKQAEYVQDHRTEYTTTTDKDWGAFIGTLTEAERAFVREYIEFVRYRRRKTGRMDK
ncbi:helix-turn-helix transcriptional regulator [Paenibacillus sp. 3LSP]|uniref:Predicted transcriptional regulators n=2 Tax=Paenibacillus TaxID=44249 RepID=A0ABY1LX47_9BACL|nr:MULTISPECIES: helix-turn-helix transcriptional regulator [Paenibacillus]MDU0330515.1 helix-turn-helix transcriptional regulator [Paenibacillus sp. 3LSP]MEC2345496.1 helix-turn-helix transcriptional regulator [Paenibacillus barengoltzii]SMF23965.1 Predicted transcriptional regulators [Paenibacillus barengoltzii]SMF24218.1 Predicted transcriptional regulators [Paenibacillus barengoltzii J12]